MSDEATTTPTPTDSSTIPQEALKRLANMRPPDIANLATSSLQGLGILNPAEGWVGTWEEFQTMILRQLWADPAERIPTEWVTNALAELRRSSAAADDANALAITLARLAGMVLFFQISSQESTT